MSSRARRWLLKAGAILIAAAGAAALLVYGRTFTLVIPQDELQSARREVLITKTHLLVFTLRYANPLVIPEEGSDRLRAGVAAEALFTVNDRKLAGTGILSGVLEELA